MSGEQFEALHVDIGLRRRQELLVQDLFGGADGDSPPRNPRGHRAGLAFSNIQTRSLFRGDGLGGFELEFDCEFPYFSADGGAPTAAPRP